MLHNLGSKSYLGTLFANDSRTASANGTGFDLEGSNGAEGEAIIILSSDAASAGSSPTLDVKLQESADNSSFSDISGATFTQVTDAASSQKISINTNDVKRYLRAVGTIGGTSSPAFTYAVELIYGKKYD
jgi:hypothetical protein|tara:strand:- start:1380 stop:1769 length:390 start_codon:yes stop_codon:yes gene_type:complete